MRDAYTGPPGTGKTRRLIELFNDSRRRHSEHKTLFLVPDSTAREHIRDLLARFSPSDVPSVFSDIGIHSFHSLVGTLAGYPDATRTHLRALISRWIADESLDSSDWPILQTPGGVESLSSAVFTLRNYGIDFEKLSAHRESLPVNSPLLDTMRLWEEWLDETNRRDEKAVLESATHKIREGEGGNRETVLIDGFTEFVPPQWELIKALVEKIDNAAVAIDPDQPPSKKLLENFLSIGFDEHKFDTSTRWDNCEDLAWLADADSWDIHAECPATVKKTGRLRIIRAGDPRVEAAVLAKEVAKCVVEGWKYSDIAIVTPGLGIFSRIFETEFRRAGIPIRIFIDRPVAGTCPGSLLLSILEILKGDWSDNAVCQFLSHPASGIPTEEARKAIEHTESISRLGDMDLWLEWSTGRTKEILRQLSRIGTDSSDTVDFARRIIELARDGLKGSWKDVPDDFISNEGWAWEKAMRTLLEAARVLDETNPSLDPASRATLLASELEGAKGRPLDRRRDTVNAVTLLGARTWGVPVAMVAGLARDYFPHRYTPNPFIPENLKASLDPPIPSIEELRERELALFRVAVTRASDRLIMTWPGSDGNGKPMLPSGPLDKIINWLPDFDGPEKVDRDPPLHLDDAVLPSDVTVAALTNNVTDDDLIDALSERTNRPLSGLVTGENYESVFLKDAGLLTDAVCGSRKHPIYPTRLNDLAQCPYRFFASTLLRLREPERDNVGGGINYRLWGTVAHEALAEWFKTNRKADFETLVRQRVNAHREILPGSHTEADTLHIIDALNRFARFEAENIFPLGFTQAEAEIRFGLGRPGDEDFREPVTLEIDEAYTLYIGGIIDRVDTKDDSVAIVIDYKRGRGSKDDNRLKEGRDFQLACYMALVENSLGLKIALACFLPLLRLQSKGTGNIIYDPAIIPLSKDSGFKLKDSQTPDDHMELVRNSLSELIEKSSSGEITPKPYDRDLCADHCAYRDLCRYRFSGDEGEDEGGGD